MRTLISLFLSLALTVNTAYAAVVGVYDVADHRVGDVTGEIQEAHLGHHKHGTAPSKAQGSSLAADGYTAEMQDQPNGSFSAADHCHAHSSLVALEVFCCAQAFSTASSTVLVLKGGSVPSIDPERFERPPRSALA